MTSINQSVVLTQRIDAALVEAQTPCGAIIRPMPCARRFPPPWTIDEHAESFIVRDATGQALGCFYFDNEPQHRSATNRAHQGRGPLHGGELRQAAGDAAPKGRPAVERSAPPQPWRWVRSAADAPPGI